MKFGSARVVRTCWLIRARLLLNPMTYQLGINNFIVFGEIYPVEVCAKTNRIWKSRFRINPQARSTCVDPEFQKNTNTRAPQLRQINLDTLWQFGLVQTSLRALSSINLSQSWEINTNLAIAIPVEIRWKFSAPHTKSTQSFQQMGQSIARTFIHLNKKKKNSSKFHSLVQNTIC